MPYDYKQDPNLFYSYNEFCPDSMMDKDDQQAWLHTKINNFIVGEMEAGKRPWPADKERMGICGDPGPHGWCPPASPLPNYNLTEEDMRNLECSHYRG